MDPTALPYIDALFKEYLLFRGFSDTLLAFTAELKADKIHGFQADRICALLFRRIVPSLQCGRLLELLQELDRHVYCRLDRSFEEAVGRMEVAVLRYFLVAAARARRPDKVKELFEAHGEALLAGREGGATWGAWFALPYLSRPESDPRFQAYFAPQWGALVEASFRNFLTQAFQQLPLPAVLRYDADRARRAELQRAVDALRRENAELRAGLGLAPAAPAPGGAAGGGGSAAAAAAAVAAAVSTDLSGRPATPAGGQAPPPPPPPPPQQQQQQQQQLRPSPHQLQAGAPAQAGTARQDQQQPQAQLQLQLYGRASGEGEEILLSTSSTASLANQDTYGGSEAGAGPAQVAAGGSQVPEEGGALSVASHMRTASLAHWCSEGAEADSLLQKAQPGSVGGAAGELSGAGRSDGGGGGSGGCAEGEQRGPLLPRELLSAGGQGEAAVTCCAFGPQGTHVASGGADGTVRVWAPRSLLRGDGGGGGSARAAAGARAGAFSCGGPVTRLAWDRRGDKLLLLGTRGRGVKAWHLDTQRVVFQADPEQDAPLVTDLACSPTDPTFACAAADYGLQHKSSLALWNLRAFKKAQSFSMPPACAVTSLCFSPDGHQLAAAGIDGKIRLFDPATRNQVMAWPAADPGMPFAASFLGSSGRLLATLSADGLVKLWSTAVVRGPLSGLHVPLCCAMAAPAAGLAPLGQQQQTHQLLLLQQQQHSAAVGGGVGWRAAAGRPLSAGAAAAAAAPTAGVQQWRPDLACNQAGTAFAAASVAGEVPVVFVSGADELRLEAGAPGHGAAAAVPALAWHPEADVLLSGAADGSLVLSDVVERQRDLT